MLVPRRPSAHNMHTSGEPTAPVAPATNMFKSISLLQRSYASAVQFKFRVSLLHCSLRRVSEADCHTVVSVHKADRDREIHEFTLIENCTRCFVGLIGYASLSNTSDRLSPPKGGTLTLVKQTAGRRPCLYQRQLFDFHPSFQQVSRVHVQAVGAVIDL